MPTQQTRQAGRFSRPGATSSPSGRFGRTSSSPSGRFGRASGTGRPSRPSRPSSSSRGIPSVRRRPQQKTSAPQKALKAVGGLIPSGKAAKKSAKGGKKPLGLAALAAGAAGLAFTQREKLQSKFGGGRQEHDADPATTGTTEPGYNASPIAPAVPPTTPPGTPGL